MFEDLDLSAIHEENARKLVKILLNQVEELSAGLRDARLEIQQLRDENNRLKGEQGKPKIKANLVKPVEKHSSEKERRKSRERHKKGKKADLEIHRTEAVSIQRETLPKDAVFKGYAEVVIQDLVFQAENVRFRKEKYYSPSERKSYLANLPSGYEGQFGPGIKAIIPALHFGGGMTEPKVLEFLGYVGIQISPAQISSLLIHGQAEFHAESSAVFEAGLKSSPHQHIDDTPTRVNGQNQACHIVCNPVYTSFHTRPHKDRLTILDVLRNGRPRIFRLNAEAFAYLESQPFSKNTRQTLQNWQSEMVLDEANFVMRLDEHLPGLPAQQRKAIIDAAAIAAYHAESDIPIIQTLICDDAPQFNWLTQSMMLCWVHEGRAYKKLMPFVAYHRDLLNDFIKRFWEFYDRLLDYRLQPTPEAALQLEGEFDALFAVRTGYGELDKRLSKTQTKKAALLLVLKYPELPLHNNPAELAARYRVRKRDISFGPRTEAGKRAWDTFMTLLATTKKLGISFYDYLRDRVTKNNAIPNLAELIQLAAKELNLGWSYALP
jgi:hypothetical protein